MASGNFNRQPSLRSQLSQISIAESQVSSSSDRTIENSLVGAVGGHIPFSPPLPCSDSKQEWNCERELRQTQQAMFSMTPKKSETESGEVVKPCKSSPSPLTPLEQDSILRNLSEKFIDMNQRVLADSIKLEKLISKVDFLEFTLSTLASTSYSGILVWKIRRFTEICEEMEKKGKVLHSPPFYTSHFGYKFCLRTNVSVIDGESFLTLYIHTMQGENDDYLSWPFLGKISLSILDAGDNVSKAHFEENIEVNEPLDPFKRSKMPRNAKGYGYKEFIPLNHVLKPTSYCNYLKNDVLCIRVIVKPKFV